jgi:hypothetical protein
MHVHLFNHKGRTKLRSVKRLRVRKISHISHPVCTEYDARLCELWSAWFAFQGTRESLVPRQGRTRKVR